MVAYQRSPQGTVTLVDGKTVPVKFIKAIFGTNPHKTPLILHDTRNFRAGQTMIGRKNTGIQVMMVLNSLQYVRNVNQVATKQYQRAKFFHYCSYKLKGKACFWKVKIQFNAIQKNVSCLKRTFYIADATLLKQLGTILIVCFSTFPQICKVKLYNKIQ